MSLFVLRRLLSLIITLAATSVVVFGVLELLPGNAAQVILGDTATPESLRALEDKLGLNRPPLTRYTDWVGGLVQGQSQMSLSYDTPTAELLLERLQVTLPLAVLAMALTVGVALALGIYAAARQNKLGDVGVMTLSQLGLAVPNFWLAILLILLFAVHLSWVSAGGFPGWTEAQGGGVLEGLKALLLPAVALAAVQSAILTRVTRSAVLDALREDYVRTARAKGMSETRLLLRHVLRNAMIPILANIGMALPGVFIGSFLIEIFFSIPGLGREVYTAVNRSDYPVIMVTTVYLAVLTMVINLMTDLLFKWVDPRVKLA